MPGRSAAPATPVDEQPTALIVRRIRWQRAKKRALVAGSAAWRNADAEERRLIAVLHARFGVQNIREPGLEWLLLGRRCAGSSDR